MVKRTATVRVRKVVRIDVMLPNMLPRLITKLSLTNTSAEGKLAILEDWKLCGDIQVTMNCFTVASKGSSPIRNESESTHGGCERTPFCHPAISPDGRLDESPSGFWK
jgi:hypothetical protein